MSRCPFATWRPSPNHGGLLVEALGAIEHVEEGTEVGTEATFANPANQVSSHFAIAKTGALDQFVDTDLDAWAQAAGNASYFSVETEGVAGEALTAAQVETFGRLYGWLLTVPNARFGLTVADTVGARGLGWHGMGGAAWGGHLGCPGELRKAQRPDILAAAGAAGPFTLTPPEEAPMDVVLTDPATGGSWCFTTDGEALYTAAGAPYVGAPNGHPEWHAGRLVGGSVVFHAQSGPSPLLWCANADGTRSWFLLERDGRYAKPTG